MLPPRTYLLAGFRFDSECYYGRIESFSFIKRELLMINRIVVTLSNENQKVTETFLSWFYISNNKTQPSSPFIRIASLI